MGLYGLNDLTKKFDTLVAVTQAGMKTELAQQANNIESRAKQILGERALEHYVKTGKTYWTGRLQNAIKSNVYMDGKTRFSMKVGVDTSEVSYAEWVEVGHKTGVSYLGANPATRTKVGGNNWWEGYHYLEMAYLETYPYISDRVLRTIKEAFDNYKFTNGQARNAESGEFSKGSSYFIK